MYQSLFLTGATGFIGSYLLREWLDRSDKTIAVLARSRRDQGPQERIQRLLERLYPGRDVSARVEVVEGDVSEDHFGLAPKRYEELASRTSHIIHCAAAARFDLEIAEARRINLGGTRAILSFARACRSLARLDYVGTAYVAGARKGLARDDELDVGQEHNNTYEKSKLEAEKAVREAMQALPIAVFRPSIVICDSQTGYASNYNGFYRALRLYWLGLVNTIPGNPSSPMDLVPVDFVADAMFRLAAAPDTIGQCYHLTAGADRTLTLDAITDLASRHLGRPKLSIIPLAEFESRMEAVADRLSEKERDTLAEIRLYAPYLASELQFDNTRLVQRTGQQPAELPAYFERFAEYLKKANPLG